MDIPKIAGNIDETKPNPEPKYQSAFIEEVDDEEEFKTHTLNPLDKNDLSMLIGLMDSMEPEEVWINARTNVATELVAEENKKKEGTPIEKLVPVVIGTGNPGVFRGYPYPYPQYPHLQ